MSIPRCLLFVPALNPERFPKALASGADAICIDLEDAVALARKAEARALLADHPERIAGGRIWIRINAAESAEGRRDLAALAGTGAPLSLLLPKVEAPEALEVLRGQLPPESRLIAIVETAAGLSRVEAIAQAGGLSALLFGPGDLSASLGCAAEGEALLYGRSRTVLAARVAGIGVMDGPWFDLADTAGAEAEARSARAIGFDGKVAVHPAQVAPILQGFTPGAAEVARARRILAAFADPRLGVTTIDGRLVDGPLIENARRVIRRLGEPL